MQDSIEVYADSLYGKPNTPENNKILEEAQIYLGQLLEEAPELFKERDSISRKLMEELEDAIIKGRGGRPAGVTKYDDRNAEIKQKKYNPKSDFIQILRNHKIPEMRFSKYCMGMLHVNKKIKYNRFKPKLLQINKILTQV
jgi:hypothetical protein